MFGSGCVCLPAPGCSEPAAHADVLLRQSGLPAEARPQRPAIQRYPAWTVSCTIFDTRALPACATPSSHSRTLRHRSRATSSRRPQTCRRSQVEQGRALAGARIARRRSPLSTIRQKGPSLDMGRRLGRLLRGPRRRRRCGAGLPGLGVGCRQSSRFRLAAHRSMPRNSVDNSSTPSSGTTRARRASRCGRAVDAGRATVTPVPAAARSEPREHAAKYVPPRRAAAPRPVARPPAGAAPPASRAWAAGTPPERRARIWSPTAMAASRRRAEAAASQRPKRHQWESRQRRQGEGGGEDEGDRPKKAEASGPPRLRRLIAASVCKYSARDCTFPVRSRGAWTRRRRCPR